MLPARFDDFGSDDILKLLENGIAEKKTLEYKAKLNINTGDEKAEFLADISSFANAAGGDIIFGISDKRDSEGHATGIPDTIAPLTIVNPDSELGRISQIIASGTQPRIVGIRAKVIHIPERGDVVLIRVPKSWNSPHMVSFANRSRFYSRNDIAGKVQLDVQQIGSAFAAQRSVGERLRGWKVDRIAKMVAGEAPASLQGPRMLLHFVSASTLSDVQTLPRIFDLNALRPFDKLMSLSPNSNRYNADGLLYESAGTASGGSYLQIFREGHLEYGDSYALRGKDDGFASQRFEDRIRSTYQNALGLLRRLDVEDPVFVSLSLIEVKGRSMWLPHEFAFHLDLPKSHPFDRQVILTPDVLIQSLTEGPPYPSTLLPIVNAIWQGAGLEETPFIAQWVVK